MAKFKSAKEQFDYIKKEFFKGNELDGITVYMLNKKYTTF